MLTFLLIIGIILAISTQPLKIDSEVEAGAQPVQDIEFKL